MSKISFLILIFIVTIYSCTPVRKVIYFQEPRAADAKQGRDTAKNRVAIDTTLNKWTDSTKKGFELRIYPSAILAITVFTVNVEAIAYFTPIGPLPADPRSGYERGFVVDVNGFVNLPLIGAINLNGMTLIQAQDTLMERLKLYVTDPIVSVKLLSFK